MVVEEMRFLTHNTKKYHDFPTASHDSTEQKMIRLSFKVFLT